MAHSTPLERWESKVDKTGDCWRWTGSTQGGYGMFWVDGRKTFAHRWGYEQLVGPIPQGLQLDHLCHGRALHDCPAAESCAHRRCVNPDHLEPVTGRENVRRGAVAVPGRRILPDLEKAREAGRQWAREHPLTDERKQRVRSLLADQPTRTT